VTDSRPATREHIRQVGMLIGKVSDELFKRTMYHDASKLESPEVEVLDVVTERLSGLTYGSEEYKASLADMGPALQHHYQHNRHHPEHFNNGIEDMNLVDLVEMFCDWLAATKRHSDGDINASISLNAQRFGIDSQLVHVLRNTAIWVRENL
jgi:hypothetical protein